MIGAFEAPRRAGQSQARPETMRPAAPRFLVPSWVAIAAASAAAASFRQPWRISGLRVLVLYQRRCPLDTHTLMARNGFRYDSRSPTSGASAPWRPPSMVKRDELAPARTAIRLRVMGMIGHDNGSAGDQPGRNNSPENYVLHGWNPPLTPPHVKRRIAPKRWRSSLVPCTDKIGHRSDRRCRRWSGRCEPRNVDRTPGVEANAVANDRCRVAGKPSAVYILNT
jgi:hypothetical protein